MNRDRLLELYRKLFELRRFDEMCLDLAMKDLIMDGFHPYQGQEAAAVGISAALRPDDVMLSNHRPQGHALAKGCTTRGVFSEMLGRATGVSQGIGGPMQFIDSPNLVFCGSIVGSGITIAAGVAAALKREGVGQISVCYFGDGAANTGSFHEGMNLASIWGSWANWADDAEQSTEERGAGLLAVVTPFEDSDVLLEVDLVHTTKGPQEISQSRPKPLHGIVMHLADAVAIIITGPFMDAVVNRRVRSPSFGKTVVRRPLIRVDCGAHKRIGLDFRL